MSSLILQAILTLVLTIIGVILPYRIFKLNFILAWIVGVVTLGIPLYVLDVRSIYTIDVLYSTFYAFSVLGLSAFIQRKPFKYYLMWAALVPICSFTFLMAIGVLNFLIYFSFVDISWL